jgi:hypothetical protein
VSTISSITLKRRREGGREGERIGVRDRAKLSK